MSTILIVGGGAAGMMAGVFAGRAGHEVHILEKNEKLGKKLYITGKGRCNVTNDCETEELFPAVVSNRKFMYSAFYSYTPQDVMAFFEEAGVPLKVERGNRVFPVSDHSSDIIRALERELKKAGVQIHLHTEVDSLCIEEGRICGVTLKKGKMPADAVIIATGGISYPATGSTGDGYRFAVESGHTVTETTPSLVPMMTKEEYIPRLQGLSLKNVALTICNGKKTLYRDFGEMMFTHCGVTGPMILSASAVVGDALQKGQTLKAFLDLKPGLSDEQLDNRILREFEAGKNKQFKNVIGSLFPASLIPVMLEIGGIPSGKPVHQISREERLGFEKCIREFPFTITGLGGFREAIITKGGVSVKDIHPGTMESRKVKNLYFAGEVLDVDALTGGYNLQIAWSTAYLAVMAVSK